MKKLLIGLAVIIMVIVLAGCSASRTAEVQWGTADDFDASSENTARTYTTPASTKYSEPGTGASYDEEFGYGVVETGSTLTSDRMVVRSGNIQMVVEQVSSAINNIANIAADNGGYVVTSENWKEEQRNIGNISIRVLAENYEKAMASIKSLAMNVTYETTTSEDVTEEYTDLQSQLKNLEAAEAQLLKIMETAEKTEDVLAIQRELTDVRGDIEQTKGRMQYLERTSSSSLISVHLEEALLSIKFSANKVRVDTNQDIIFTSEVDGGFSPYSYLWDFGDGETSIERNPTHGYSDSGYFTVELRVTDDKGYTNVINRSEYIYVEDTWNPGSVMKSAWNGFIVFGKGFLNVMLWLLAFSPLWIVIGVVVWLIVRRKRKVTAKKAAEKAAEKKE